MTFFSLSLSLSPLNRSEIYRGRRVSRPSGFLRDLRKKSVHRPLQKGPTSSPTRSLAITPLTYRQRHHGLYPTHILSGRNPVFEAIASDGWWTSLAESDVLVSNVPGGDDGGRRGGADRRLRSRPLRLGRRRLRRLRRLRRRGRPSRRRQGRPRRQVQGLRCAVQASEESQAHLQVGAAAGAEAGAAAGAAARLQGNRLFFSL